MFHTIRSMREAAKARRVLDLARIEALIAANDARLETLREADECKWCKVTDAEVSA